MRKLLSIVAPVLLCLTGCVSTNQMTLFSYKSSQISIPKAPVFVIEPNDSLKIEFSSINEDAVKPFNSAGSSFAVNEEGVALLPVIGSVKLSGLSTEQAAKKLQELVSGHVLNPIVRVSISSATITVLGEVNHPASIRITQPITFLDALGRAGGLTTNARCNDVLIQRRENGMIRQYHINLLTEQLFSSPCYYLIKGDVVNISPLRPSRR